MGTVLRRHRLRQTAVLVHPNGCKDPDAFYKKENCCEKPRILLCDPGDGVKKHNISGKSSAPAMGSLRPSPDISRPRSPGRRAEDTLRWSDQGRCTRLRSQHGWERSYCSSGSNPFLDLEAGRTAPGKSLRGCRVKSAGRQGQENVARSRAWVSLSCQKASSSAMRPNCSAKAGSYA